MNPQGKNLFLMLFVHIYVFVLALLGVCLGASLLVSTLKESYSFTSLDIMMMYLSAAWIYFASVLGEQWYYENQHAYRAALCEKQGITRLPFNPETFPYEHEVATRMQAAYPLHLVTFEWVRCSNHAPVPRYEFMDLAKEGGTRQARLMWKYLLWRAPFFMVYGVIEGFIRGVKSCMCALRKYFPA